MSNRELAHQSAPARGFVYFKLESDLRRLDFVLFEALFILVALYKIQMLFPVLAKLHLREILYVYLYFRMLVTYWPPLTKIMFYLALMIGLSAAVGALTYVAYGPHMAAKGFMRFVNVMLLAPLAATFIRDEEDIRRMLNIWMFIFVIGAATAVYQLMGGNLPIFDDRYYASKEHNEALGKAIRFQTLIGEANVGGMASSIVLLNVIYLVRSKLWVSIACVAMLVLLILSMSKAAVAGVFLAVVLVAVIHMKAICRVSKFLWRKVWTILFVMVLGVSVVMVVIPDIMSVITMYSEGIAARVSGDQEFASGTMSIGEDLTYRIYGLQVDGFRLVKSQSDLYLPHILIGSTYGVVGSAAAEVRGDANAHGPHNSLAEIYFAGGLLMLGVFLILLFWVTRRLYYLSRGNTTFACLFSSFVVMLFILPTYPIIYEPVIGSIFWLIVGVAARKILICNEVLSRNLKAFPASKECA